MKVVLNFVNSTMILCLGMTTNVYHKISGCRSSKERQHDPNLE